MLAATGSFQPSTASTPISPAPTRRGRGMTRRLNSLPTRSAASCPADSTPRAMVPARGGSLPMCTMEVVATPGHTPDAISLLDRVNGLLFTGDTYYPATIWLYRPETDLNAYDASIRRLAALRPKIKKVLGAHNVPVSAPAVLAQLLRAFEEVRLGKARASPTSGGQVVYRVGDIAFLMRAPAPKP